MQATGGRKPSDLIYASCTNPTHLGSQGRAGVCLGSGTENPQPRYDHAECV